MVMFLFFSFIYYIPSLLVGLISRIQNKKKAIYRVKNSKIPWGQSFLTTLLYFVLVGEVGFNICTTYVEIKHGIIVNDTGLFILVLIIPNLVQFLNSLAFLPKYWNPQIKEFHREALLYFFFLINIYYTIKITSLILITSSLVGIFLVIGALPALPSFFVIYFIVAKSSVPDSNFSPDEKVFFSWKLSRRLIYLVLFYSIIVISQREIIYRERVKWGISPDRALNISREDLLTDEKYILGPDKNQNQIRDDYESWVETKYVDHDVKMAMLQYGYSQYRYMEATLVGMKKIQGKKELARLNLEEADRGITEYYVRQHLFWAGACVDYVSGNFDRGDFFKKEADAILINNKDRYDVDKIADFSGGGFNIPLYEGCLFTIKKDANNPVIISKNLRNELLASIAKGDAEKVKMLSQQLSFKNSDDFMLAQISTAALIKEDENILNILFDNGLDFRKKFRDGIYAFSDEPYSVAKGMGAKESLKWFDSKYKKPQKINPGL